MINTLTKNGGETPATEVMKDSLIFSPRFDIWEDEDELVLCGDLPGVGPEDLDLHFEKGELKIFGRVPPRHLNNAPIYSEYGIGDFQRTFSLSEMIDSENISAELKNGVLTVHLPKSEAVKPRRIEVKS
ncbi:MAG: Hsp20/alpha crystallin family protein [Pirellulaceae bacterium]